MSSVNHRTCMAKSWNKDLPQKTVIYHEHNECGLGKLWLQKSIETKAQKLERDETSLPPLETP